MIDVRERKASLRAEYLQKRRALVPDDVRLKSALITARLLSLPEFQRLGSVHIYLAKTSDNEIDTTGLVQHCLKKHIAVFVPLITSNGKMRHSRLHSLENLRSGPFGILQPEPGELLTDKTLQVDLIIVPGIAFDKSGHRLGYGQGYYDRFLATRPDWVLRVGLCDESLIAEQLPVTELDQHVNRIVTNQNLYIVS